MNRRFDMKVTPTLLDAYEWMVSQDDEQAYEVAKRELIAKLNREEQPISEVADRGTALNNIIDDLLFHPDPYDLERTTFGAVVHDRTFLFDGDLCRRLAAQLQDAGDCQVYGCTYVDTPRGARVKVCGYADYVCLDRIVDLKSTSSYAVGKFRNHWQHICYPLMFTDGGQISADDYDHFDYLVCEFSGKNTLYNGTIRTETYRHSLTVCHKELVEFLDTQWLPFVENHMKEIVNDYYFGES